MRIIYKNKYVFIVCLVKTHAPVMAAPGETALCMALRFIFDGDKTTLFGCIFFAAGDEERNLGLAPLKPLCPWWTMYWLFEFEDWFC